MIIRNKKYGTNILAFQNTSIIFKAHETIDIPSLISFDQITNKADFGKRGWFEIVDENKKSDTTEETSLEKAKKEVKEYSKKKNKEEEVAAKDEEVEVKENTSEKNNEE